jgi:hypothetical protein
MENHFSAFLSKNYFFLSDEGLSKEGDEKKENLSRRGRNSPLRFALLGFMGILLYEAYTQNNYLLIALVLISAVLVLRS